MSAYDHLRESLRLESTDRRKEVLKLIKAMADAKTAPGVSYAEVTREYLRANPPEGVRPRMLRPGYPEFEAYKKQIRSDMEALVKSGQLKKTVVFQKGYTKAVSRGKGSPSKKKEARFALSESLQLEAKPALTFGQWRGDYMDIMIGDNQVGTVQKSYDSYGRRLLAFVVELDTGQTKEFLPQIGKVKAWVKPMRDKLIKFVEKNPELYADHDT